MGHRLREFRLLASSGRGRRVHTVWRFYLVCSTVCSMRRSHSSCLLGCLPLRVAVAATICSKPALFLCTWLCRIAQLSTKSSLKPAWSPCSFLGCSGEYFRNRGLGPFIRNFCLDLQGDHGGLTQFEVLLNLIWFVPLSVELGGNSLLHWTILRIHEGANAILEIHWTQTPQLVIH